MEATSILGVLLVNFGLTLYSNEDFLELSAMRLRYLAQSSYWKYRWIALQTQLGWDTPGYVQRARARQKMDDDTYTARLQLQYGATAFGFFLLGLLFLAFSSGWAGALSTLGLLVATIYFGARTMRVPYLYQSVASSPGMQRAWAELSPENVVVAHVEEPLMIDYWDAVDPLGSLAFRDKVQWHLREWLQR